MASRKVGWIVAPGGRVKPLGYSEPGSGRLIEKFAVGCVVRLSGWLAATAGLEGATPERLVGGGGTSPAPTVSNPANAKMAIAMTASFVATSLDGGSPK